MGAPDRGERGVLCRRAIIQTDMELRRCAHQRVIQTRERRRNDCASRNNREDFSPRKFHFARSGVTHIGCAAAHVVAGARKLELIYVTRVGREIYTGVESTTTYVAESAFANNARVREEKSMENRVSVYTERVPLEKKVKKKVK